MSCTKPVTEPAFEMGGELFEINAEDEYCATPIIGIQWYRNDQDYPIGIEGKSKDGRDIGVVLTKKDVKHIVALAWAAGII